MVIVWWGGRRPDLKVGTVRGAGEQGKRGKESNTGGEGGGAVGKLKVLWMVPVVYGVIAGVEAVLAGSVVGLM